MKKSGIILFSNLRYIFLAGVISLILITIVGMGGGSSSANNALAITSDYGTDGMIDGPGVGISPNDSDNTFHSLAVHPTDPNTVLIGNEGNGIFKSVDGGLAWRRINIGLHYSISINAYPEIYELIFDTRNPDKIYAATTGGPGPTTSGGIGGFYYSNDKGETWTRSIAGIHNYAVVSLAQDQNNPDIIYIGMDNAISTGYTPTDNSGPNMYKSSDGGLTWVGLNLPVTNNRICNIIIDPADSNTIYCEGWEAYTLEDLSSNHLGFAKSTDAGQTWVRINNGLPSLKNGCISIDPNNSSMLYCSIWTDEGAAPYKTTDGGANWVRFQTEGPARSISNLKVSPHNSDTIIGSTSSPSNRLYVTSDGGSTWSEALDYSGAGIIFKKIQYTGNENIVYGSADQLKVYKSVDGGATFSAVIGDLQSFIGH